MTPLFWIKFAKSLDSAPAVRKVQRVAMLRGPNVGAKVESGSWEHADMGRKQALKARCVVIQFVEFASGMTVKLRCK